MIFLKSFGLSFILSIFASFYYAEWYCSISSKPYIARTYEYNSECSSMTTGLAPMFRAFIVLLPVSFMLFFVLFKLLKGRLSHIAGKVTLAIFVVGLIVILYSIGFFNFGFL